MAFELETPTSSSGRVLETSILRGLNSLEAAGLILDSLGEKCHSGVRHAGSEGSDNVDGSLDEMSVLCDAEQVLRATGPATAELLRAIYLNEWLIGER